MSITNLTSDNGFQPTVRPAFARDEIGRRLARVVERYQNSVAPSKSDAEDVRQGLKLLLGGQSQVNYEEMANALLARLDALRANRPAEQVVELKNKAFDLMEARRGQMHWKVQNKKWHSASTPSVPQVPQTSASPPPAAPSPSTPPVQNSPTPPAPSNPPPGPNGPLTPGSTVMLANGNNTLDHLAINASGIGILGDNATSVGTLNVSDSTINSSDYAFYIGQADAINLTRVTAITGASGENPYGIRVGSSPMVRIVDSVFDNSASVSSATAHGRMAKNSIRLAGVTEAGSGIFNSTVRGGQIMLGGGAADERTGWQAFGNFTISGGTFDCTDPMATALQIYGGVGQAGPVVIENWNVTSDGPYFASIYGNATNITFRNVTYNGEPLSWEHFHNSAALQQYASQPGVNIRIEP